VTDPTERRGLDSFDGAIIDFVLTWAPYGGPPADEVLPRFGIPSAQLPERVREIACIALREKLSASEHRKVARALAAVRHIDSD